MEEQRFFVVPGFSRAAYAVSVVPLVIAALGFATNAPILLVVFGVATSVLIFGVARFTAKTPVVVVREREIVVRAAMLAPERTLDVASLRGFSHADGYVSLLPKSGEALALPMTSFTQSDARALLGALEAKLPKV